MAATAIDMSELAMLLRRSVPLAVAVRITESDPASIVVELDAGMVSARAEQQGLTDRSVAAAARSERVHRVVRKALCAIREDYGTAFEQCVLADDCGTPLARVVTDRG